MTVTDTNGRPTVDEPAFTRTRPPAPGWLKAFRWYWRKPVVARVLIGGGIVVGAGYAGWTYAASPVIDGRVDAAVGEMFDRDSAAFTAAVLAQVDVSVDEKLAVIQDRIDPVVVASDPLAWLPCPLNKDAEGLIGGNAASGNTSLDPVRAKQVEGAVREKLAQGVKLTDMRLTTAGGLRVVVEAGVGAPLLDCAATQGGVASAGTPPAAVATPVTPPAAAN